MRLTNLLVPIDFSSRSRAALGFAIGLAREQPAAITLLHVLPAPSGLATILDAYSGRPLPHPAEAAFLDAHEQLDSLVASFDHVGITIHQRVEVGDPAAVITTIATEDRDDLIIIGTRGRIGLSDLLLGSVAKQLVSCAPCPLVTLRDGC